MSSKEEKNEEQLLVIFSAPSGCGKTTVVDRLLKRHPDWVRSISVTTRQPREGEKNGVDYLFLTSKEFEETKNKGDFLEYAQIYDYSYGTPKSFIIEQLKSNKTVILAIDIQGADKVKEVIEGQYPMITIFILPPSMKVLKERLSGRKTEKPEEIEQRLQVAEEEIKRAKHYDFTVVNQNLEQTVLEIDDIINKFKKERK